MVDDREPRHIVIPGLPNPYEGITDEIVAELTKDAHGFTRRVLETISPENPHLIRADIPAAIIMSPYPSLSLSVYAAYYEIFSRSARREGVPMMVVSAQTIDSLMKEHEIQEEELNDEEIVEDAQRKINRDAQRSIELGKFWDYLNTFGMTIADRYSPVERYEIFLPTLVLQETFQRQEEINSQLQASSFNRTNGRD